MVLWWKFKRLVKLLTGHDRQVAMQHELTQLSRRLDDLYLLVRGPAPASGFKVRTEHPLAIYSDDHQSPRGTRFDNTRSLRFVHKTEALFGRKIRHLDLGCAGGGLVADFLQRGHESIGIEGSDYSLLYQRAEWRMIPGNLFVADITKPFEIVAADGGPGRFDLITAWEVLEHLPEPLLAGFFANVHTHLADAGLFVVSVATHPDFDPVTKAVWHVTLKPREWWHARLADAGFEVVARSGYETRDFVRGAGNPSAPDWDAVSDPDKGFHVVARRKQP